MDFKKPEQLAMWAGIVPSVYQSADKLITGSITKQGSKHLRWILVPVAHAITHKKGGKLKKFFLKIKAKKGYLVAIVALAIWFFIGNSEEPKKICLSESTIVPIVDYR